MYAGRVKTLKAEDWADAQLFSNHEIPFDILVKLLHHGPQPLLPNLRLLTYSEIYWLNKNEPVVSGRGPLYRSEPLFGPRLKEVDIDFGDWPSDELRPTEVVWSLSYRSPLVESITISQHGICYHKHDLSRSARLVGPAIGTLVHLVKFDSRMVFTSPPALWALGSLPKLQELAVYVDPTEYHWDALPHGRCSNPFPALKGLSLVSVPLEWSVAFMGIVSSPSLRTVDIKFQDSNTAVVHGMLLEAFCTSIANHPSGDSVQEISFNLDVWGDSRKTTQVYLSQHISPLLSLPALQKLSVHGSSVVVVNDAFLDAVTWSWPNLRSLQIYWPTSNIGRTGIGPGELGYPEATLAGVLLLVRYCPRLISLNFPVDMRSVPSLNRHRPPVTLWPSYESPLETFCPTGSSFRADDAAALAMFLSVIFPHLKSFGFPWQDDDNCAKVMGLHRQCLMIRWQERRWMFANGRRFREPEPDPYLWEESDEAALIRESTFSAHYAF